MGVSLRERPSTSTPQSALRIPHWEWWRGDGGGTVRAPMPGVVVRIEVVEGQQVDAGAGLVVVEAMKMENELRAPRSGMVQTVHVAVGQAVEKGASLVTLASPEPSG